MGRLAAGSRRRCGVAARVRFGHAAPPSTRRERRRARWLRQPATRCGCSSSSAILRPARQRTACRDYQVPPEVQVRMGLLPTAPAPGKPRARRVLW